VHMDGVPGGLQAPCQARSGAHQSLRPRARSDAHQQCVARLPYRGHRRFAAVGQHFVVHAVGRAAQCQLAQGDEVTLAKKVANRPFSLLRQVDLALLQALQQVVGR
jgi:hypothetical protein